MSKSLAIKYRPQCWKDLTEQEAVVAILTNQIETNTVKHGYLFCGSAGCGKTTSARIFANMINHGKGTPIELDAASNNSVEDIRELIEQAQTQSLDSEYKVFIIDEVHMLSTAAFNAFLKTLEEPPAKSIFIMATTNPEKIPATILSRVQRYNFQRISQQGIVNRLVTILQKEQADESVTSLITMEDAAIEYIAKIADGGMRDAITLMDKCLSFSTDLTMENVIKALGVANYADMIKLNNAVFSKSKSEICDIINNVYNSGMDLKLFIKTYFEFILDLNIYALSHKITDTKIPGSFENEFKNYSKENWNTCVSLLEFLVDLNADIKWEQNPKAVIIAKFMIFCKE